MVLNAKKNNVDQRVIYHLRPLYGAAWPNFTGWGRKKTQPTGCGRPPLATRTAAFETDPVTLHPPAPPQHLVLRS